MPSRPWSFSLLAASACGLNLRTGGAGALRAKPVQDDTDSAFEFEALGAVSLSHVIRAPPAGDCSSAREPESSLYIPGRYDGIGGTAHSVILGMAVAAEAGMNFGGMLTEAINVNGTRIRCDYCGEQAFSQHSGGSGTLDQIAGFLGVDKASRLFKTTTPPIDATVGRLEGLYQQPHAGRANIVYNTQCDKCALEVGGKALPALTPGFLDALRARVRGAVSPWFGQVDAFRPGVPRVALHVRRGNDVLSHGAGGMRFTPDAFYFLLARYIRTILPTADIHAWSSTEGRHSASDFDEYAKRNITVHLDGDPMHAWAHLASAHVLVMAKSTFSHIPAMINPACVIYQPWNYRNPGSWLNQTVSERTPQGGAAEVADHGRRHTFRQQLRRCVADGLANPLRPEDVCEGECAAAASLPAPPGGAPAAGARTVRSPGCRPALPS